MNEQNDSAIVPAAPSDEPATVSPSAVADAVYDAAAESGELAPPPGADTPPLMVRVFEIIQTVLTALLLAFIFRAYFIEAFIIPTGSMASGLVGDHGTRVCPICGWEFDFGPSSSANVGTPDVFRGGVQVRCPNCHDSVDLEQAQVMVKAGDRILVHKWPYIFWSPQRWDVIVFRDPADPAQNFIKRLIGLPGDSLEIIDGDVYVRRRGEDRYRIQRKTAAAQSALWTVVFDQNYLPLDRIGEAGSAAPWTPVLDNPTLESRWSGYDTRVVRYTSQDQTPRELRFAPIHSRLYLQDMHGYNGGTSGGNGAPPYIGDMRVRAELTPEAPGGSLALELRRDGRLFRATLELGGRLRIETSEDAHPDVLTIWTDRDIPPPRIDEPLLVEFGHVDYRVYAKLGDTLIAESTDEQYAPDVEALRTFKRVEPVRVQLVATGCNVALRGLRIDRDVHYAYNRHNTLRAYAGLPFQLREGEYFVMGDNTASSHDSREWYRVGPHLTLDEEAGRYQIGTVREDQIVGQAYFVYLPGLLAVDSAGRVRIPDIGRMRLVR